MKAFCILKIVTKLVTIPKAPDDEYKKASRILRRNLEITDTRFIKKHTKFKKMLYILLRNIGSHNENQIYL